MTEQEARNAPLWEVWKRHWELNILYCAVWNDKERKMLRGVLLEGVEKVKDTYGNYDSFSIAHDAEGRWIIDIEHCGQDREDDAETARNMSAAYAFMAWELEQRQNAPTPLSKAEKE